MAQIRNPLENPPAQESAYAGGRRSEVAVNRRESTGLSCPQCGWNDVRVSYHARLWDYVLAVLILAPLRCRKCRLRFYRPWYMVRRAASGPAPEVETRSAAPAVETRSTLPVVIIPRTQPVSDIPLATSMPVVQGPFVPTPDAVPTPDVVPSSDVALPVPQQPLAETPAATPIPTAETKPPTILLVDRDAAMRKLLAMLLHREGYAVRHAADSSQAMAALSASGVDVVVANLSDEEQPILIREWRSAHPELGIIALTGGTETKISLNRTSKNNFLTLPLPSRPRDVVQAVQALLDGSRTTKALRMEPPRIEPSRATQCAPQSSAHTPRRATGWQP
jgi:CheY-like chemotaxis protein